MEENYIDIPDKASFWPNTEGFSNTNKQNIKTGEDVSGTSGTYLGA